MLQYQYNEAPHAHMHVRLRRTDIVSYLRPVRVLLILFDGYRKLGDIASSAEASASRVLSESCRLVAQHRTPLSEQALALG